MYARPYRGAPGAGKGQIVCDERLLGHWPLECDARDISGACNHGRPYGVQFGVEGPCESSGTAARFDGRGASIEIPASDALKPGTGDFTLCAWVRTDDPTLGPIGDIASMWDAQERRGFGLSIHGSAAGYCGMGDVRSVHFGLDNAMDHPWVDCGKPWPSNTGIASMAVWNGDLYVGIADADGDKRDACHVFRYVEPGVWEDCGRVGESLRTHTAYSLVVFNGALYCGTGRYDWCSVGPQTCDFVRVYRYDGGTEWVDCGQPGRNYRILSLAPYDGALYCGTDAMAASPDAGKVYRWGGGTGWMDCGRLGCQYSVFALCVYRGRLFGGTQWGEVYRYEGGVEWAYIGRPFGNTQIHCLTVYRGGLVAGTWPEGIVARWEGGLDWSWQGALGDVTGHTYGETDNPQVSPINEVNDLTVHNGKLYAGVIPKGEVYRRGDDGTWTMVRRLVTAPDYNPHHTDGWSRVTCMAAFRGRLFAATSSCRGAADPNAHREAGAVFSTMAGQCVSHDHDIGPGWHHIAAMRRWGRLELWIDGARTAVSEPFPSASYDLDSDAPLRIGAGALDTFRGDMCDVRLYRRGLAEDEVRAAAASGGGAGACAR